MCEPYPGPRCSADMAQKHQQRKIIASEIIQKFGADSVEASRALAKLQKAQTEFNSTPEGIKQLTEIVDRGTDSSASIRDALIEGKLTRRLQQISLKEIQSGRVQNFAKLFSKVRPFYDTGEHTSVIESVRDAVIKKLIHDKDNSEENFTASPEEYNKFLGKLREHLISHNTLDAGSAQALTELQNAPAPDRVSLHIYQQSLSAFNHSRKQLINEIKTIATLQGVSPQIAVGYYEAYRNQYKTLFQHKPESERPDPPHYWSRGEFSGFANDANSRYAPQDPASLYAIYRLRSDDKAIPDHFKHSRGFVAINIKEIEDQKTQVGVKSYTSSGKAVKEFTAVIEPTSKVEIAEISNMIDGKVLLLSEQETGNQWLTKTLPDYNENTPTLNPVDVARKHYDLHNHKLETICNTAGTKYPDSTEPIKIASAFADSFFQMRKMIRKQWQQKPVRKMPIPIEPVLSSRWTNHQF